MKDFSFFFLKHQRKVTGGNTDKTHIITTNNVMEAQENQGSMPSCRHDLICFQIALIVRKSS